MNQSGTAILHHLGSVRVERAARAADPALAERVTRLKRYQQARFARTYADLLADPRYAGAARFFFDDLYGPGDFSQRDAQFARIVPALVRLFPSEVVGTVEALTALHALSEQLDSEMARHVDKLPVTASLYVAAWRRTGQPANRRRQIGLMLEVGHALDVYTHRPLLRHSLRAMRIPARAAGLSALQTFLESGFDTFRAMRGADQFLTQIAQREASVAASLFGVGSAPDPLGQLP
ncbi:MAG: hypothetical protein Q8L49_01920 [Burkholderiaceae bacterium]|nr:hypothetical protein [Burkholderiaceae bacterium]